MGSLEVLSGPERRRRWSLEQKRAIVASAFAPGAVVREVARQADVTANLIYRWRRDFGGGSSGFARVVVAPCGAACDAAPGQSIDIEFFGNSRVRIPTSVPAALAAAVVEALVRR